MSAWLCLFVAFCVLDESKALDAIVDMWNAQYALSMTGDDVVALGQKVLTMEREFNEAAGFTKAAVLSITFSVNFPVRYNTEDSVKIRVNP